MFSKIGLITTALTLSLGAAIYQFQIKMQPQDRAAYLCLIEKPIEEESAQKKTIQERIGVKKEIWTVKNGQRMLFRLTSKHSVLTINRTLNKFEISEKLKDLTCCMQEEISLVNDKKMQEIRTLSAETGTYLLPSHQFITDAVHLKFFRLLGDTLPLYPITITPYLSGQAFRVAFGANNETLQFTAGYLKADLDPKQVFHKDR